MFGRVGWVFVAVVGLSCFLGTRHAAGMPMFARKLDVGCDMCHTTIPKLNERGMMFRASGFRVQDDIGKEDKDVNNISTENSTRLQTRFDATRTADAKTSGGKIAPDSKNSQLTFFEITLYPLSGAFNKNYASLFEISIVPEDFAEIENAYIRGDWKAGSGVFEGRVGIFHPFEGFGASDRPLSISRPLIQTAAVKDSFYKFPFTPWNFDQSGLEVGYVVNRTIVTATVFNGLTYDAAEGKAFPAQGGQLQKTTGRPSTGNKDIQVFLTQILNANGGGASAYFYDGSIDLPGPLAGTFFQDRYFRAAGYASYPVVERLTLLAGYQQGNDKYVINKVETTSTSKGFFGEADVDLTHSYFAAGRYDWIDPSDNAEKDRVQSVTLAVNRPFNNGLQLIAEYQHRLTEQQGAQSSGAAYPDKKDDNFQIRSIWIW